MASGRGNGENQVDFRGESTGNLRINQSLASGRKVPFTQERSKLGVGDSVHSLTFYQASATGQVGCWGPRSRTVGS